MHKPALHVVTVKRQSQQFPKCRSHDVDERPMLWRVQQVEQGKRNTADNSYGKLSTWHAFVAAPLEVAPVCSSCRKAILWSSEWSQVYPLIVQVL